ncbi:MULTISPECIES: GntR family transcriptional regulator [Rhodococcus]|uniref:DNA-binding GntR family transcriptional regulator n=1 Tax=Rhodococcus rhodochrous J45 TaxID=935266 RepID=A0A562EQJ3_RHORH|nr:MULTISPECIES: GntR family transcriptional regulator [Rhodococcus]AYA24060.1 GntR family transcriptional regulator [Rhodococcus rhodochrous]MBF4479980.1 GntR family transcriptional regulator [Rhodococcus rhodochrous]MCD2098881.1 GntR family transcriptional regulator [Rhodococcus rhodochrous]MCD2123241.1 GntR family transcriptional regulator [Rhodococcus rhodochrous]MCQ4137241.1 GntR family transcriptional regulator [Rhodococcus rhodochrous]
MDYKVRETEPAYAQLARQLREAVEAGRYSDGTRLPTEAELAEEHGVSRQTVRRAFQDLVADGIVYRVPGRGTFANESGRRYRRQLGSIEDLLALSADTVMQIVSPLRRGVDIDAASRLRLDTDVLYTAVFKRLHDGIPFVLTTVHLPESVAAHVLDAPELQAGASSRNTMIGLLEPHLDSPIVEAAQSITVALATEQVATELNCEVGHPLLRVDRLYSNDDGVPTELSVSYFLPEHYTYRVTLRRAGL